VEEKAREPASGVHSVSVPAPSYPPRASGAPFLLTMPEYNGTLAAARCLGRQGIRVTMAGSSVTAPARWSRYVSRWVAAPDVTDPQRFLEWLMDFGAREPGHVLYPTCDELVWLIGLHAHDLSQYFRLYQPDVGVALRLLDKKALHEACTALDIPTLPTRFPRDAAEAEQAAGELGFPLLLKPRTQIYLTSRSKGNVVASAERLPRDYATFMERNQFHPLLAQVLPGVASPMLQSYRPRAAEGIYSLAGFIGPGENEVAVRGAMKIFQRPRRLGVGLCFEEAAVDREALEWVVRLSRALGYYGVFETEFVPENGRLHLLDFNPRFYGQMGFEIARSLPLGYMVWLAALDKRELLAEALADSNKWQEGRGYIYCHRFYLNLLITLRRTLGRMTPEEARHWKHWLDRRHALKLAVDATDSPHDHVPGLVSVAHEIVRAMRYPRSFLLSNIVDL
jgi:predicted ATP-grasp superfamily ATP-dependent carboligase